MFDDFYFSRFIEKPSFLFYYVNSLFTGGGGGCGEGAVVAVIIVGCEYGFCDLHIIDMLCVCVRCVFSSYHIVNDGIRGTESSGSKSFFFVSTET